MNYPDTTLLESLLRRLAHELTALSSDAESALEIWKAGMPAESTTTTARVSRLIDQERFAVRWGGRICLLGPTLPYRLLRRLARAGDRFVSFDRLMDDVWGGQRSTSAVRSVVYELRRRLRAAGMDAVAVALEGIDGHYRLRVSELLSGA